MRDPGEELEGEGKLMRHLRFGRDTPIDDARCIDFIKQAVALD